MLALLFFSQKNSIEEGNFDDPGGRLHKKQPIICVFSCLSCFSLPFLNFGKRHTAISRKFLEISLESLEERANHSWEHIRDYSFFFTGLFFVFFVFILLLFEKKTDRMMMTIDDYHSSNPLLYHFITLLQIVCQNIRIFNFTNATKEIQRWKVENSFTDSAVRIKTVSI